MSNLLIIHSDSSLSWGEGKFLHQLEKWNFYYLNQLNPDISTVTSLLSQKDIHFLVYAQSLNSFSLVQLNKIRQHFPLVHIIFYNSQLKSEEFAELYIAGVDYCIIGDARQINLLNTLQKLWKTHWKRVPLSIFPDKTPALTDRGRKIIFHIETHPLSEINSNAIASSLNISESHFRAEFKKLFGISFRRFKQRLVAHYETKLLFEKHLKPREIFDVLNYKNISAFSRSFRLRHGISWQEIVRQQSNSI